MPKVQHNARGAATREMLLESALSLVSKYGYDSTSIAKLEKATNRPASSIYWLFKNKDALIVEALETAYEQQPTRWNRWDQQAPSDSLRKQLADNLTPDFLTSELKAPVRLGILLSLEGAANKEAIRAPYRYRREVAIEGFNRWWEKALNGSASPDMVRWLSMLIVLFLDGHYISDDNISKAMAARNATTVSEILASVAESRCIDAAVPTVKDRETSGQTTTNSNTTLDPESVEYRLLVATRALVAKHGYEGATFAKIMKMSGVKKSSVYWRYEDKDALVCEAVAQPFLNNLAPFKELGEVGEDWTEHLVDAFLQFLENVEANPITVKSGLLLKLLKWDEPAKASVVLNAGTTEVGEHLVKWIQQVLPESRHRERNARDIAWAIARLCDGIMYLYSSENSESQDIPLRALMPCIIDGLKNAMEKQD